MKKSTTSQKINQLFSAFLIFAFIICTYFIETFLDTLAEPSVKMIAQLMIFALFGLFLFYATRVGDGKPVLRFSLSTLLLVVLPAAYAIAATYSDALPLHEILASSAGENMVKLASVAFGYGLPYMFISGFELSVEEEDAQPTEETELEHSVQESELDEDMDVAREMLVQNEVIEDDTASEQAAEE